MSKKASGPETASGPRMVRRERWMDLPDQETYPGFKALVWTNHPARLWAVVTGGKSNAEMGPALAQIVREHNGWCEPDGTPFPPISDPSFWDVIPDELARQIFLLVLESYRAPLPNSPSATSPSSGSG